MAEDASSQQQDLRAKLHELLATGACTERKSAENLNMQRSDIRRLLKPDMGTKGRIYRCRAPVRDARGFARLQWGAHGAIWR